MAWTVEFERDAERELKRLDPQHARRILQFLHTRVAQLEDPRSVGEALKGTRLGEFWKYRVGDHRLICDLQDNRLVVLVLRVGDRREVYKTR